MASTCLFARIVVVTCSAHAAVGLKPFPKLSHRIRLPHRSPPSDCMHSTWACVYFHASSLATYAWQKGGRLGYYLFDVLFLDRNPLDCATKRIYCGIGFWTRRTCGVPSQQDHHQRCVNHTSPDLSYPTPIHLEAHNAQESSNAAQNSKLGTSLDSVVEKNKAQLLPHTAQSPLTHFFFCAGCPKY